VTIAFAISPGHECAIGLATFRVLVKGDLDADAALASAGGCRGR
jgi:hypothetical protein